jgi:hypothetical protein
LDYSKYSKYWSQSGCGDASVQVIQTAPVVEEHIKEYIERHIERRIEAFSARCQTAFQSLARRA